MRRRRRGTQKEEGIGIGGVVGVFAQTGKFVGQRREGAEEHRRKRGLSESRNALNNLRLITSKSGADADNQRVFVSRLLFNCYHVFGVKTSCFSTWM